LLFISCLQICPILILMITTVAIMQPTYLPWIGYFDLMDQADCFVFLDSVQFNRRSWQQRNRIKGPDGEIMLTVPVLSKGKRHQLICDVEIDSMTNFSQKHLKAIYHNYKKASFFSAYYQGFSEILGKPHKLLCDLNIEITHWFMEQLGIQCETVRSSSLNVSGAKAKLLYNICQQIGGSVYLSAEGSKEYIEQNNPFQEGEIGLIYHDFQHPEYNQLFGSFIPYLSVLDLLLNEGTFSLNIIRSGRKNR
jgi:hypothetical protein